MPALPEFEFTAITNITPDSIRIHRQSRIDECYSVLVASSVTNTYCHLLMNIEATPPSNALTLTNLAERGFYRLLLEL
ncbi:MAG: hypothetical protein ACUVWX_11640 [Kiritimatiellia bacterium]